MDRDGSGSLVGPELNADLRFSDWGIHINTSKGTYALYRAKRPDLAHLTLMTKTQSGKVHIHLTYGHESRGASSENYRITLAEFHPDELAGAIQVVDGLTRRFSSNLLASHRKWRPGWLASKGYTVQVVEGSVVLDWLTACVPRVRQKYRVDPKLFDPSQIPEHFFETLYDPRVLNLLDEWPSTTPIRATRIHRGQFVRGDTIELLPIQRYGRLTWWGMREGAIRGAVLQLLPDIKTALASALTPEHPRKFEAIVRGLGLEEVEAMSKFVSRTRQFLQRSVRTVHETTGSP